MLQICLFTGVKDMLKCFHDVFLSFKFQSVHRILIPKRHVDDRGWLNEIFNEQRLSNTLATSLQQEPMLRLANAPEINLRFSDAGREFKDFRRGILPGNLASHIFYFCDANRIWKYG